MNALHLPEPDLAATCEGGRTWTAAALAGLEAAGDRPVSIVRGEGSWTGHQLLRATAACVDLLTALPGDAGDLVPVVMRTGPLAQALLLAGTLAGRPIAPLSDRFTITELRSVLDPLGARNIITEPHSAPFVAELARSAGLEPIVLEGIPSSDHSLIDRTSPDQIAAVLHTSGTTGRPKRVSIDQRRLSARTATMRRILDLDARSVFAATSPFHHIAGIGNLAVATEVGATLVDFGWFSMEAWHELRSLGLTHLSTISPVLTLLEREGQLDVPTLRTITYGAAPIDPDVVVRALRALPDVRFVTLYGQTEGSPITWLTPDDHRRALAGDISVLSSVGRAVPGTEIRVDEPDDHGVGEVLARGSHLGTGPDSWQHTGDLGTIDDSGLLRLVGRKGDMIIRGGENVYPEEVERALRAHPGVADVVVVGVPDPRTGETVKAFIVPALPTQPPGLEDLHQFTRARLSGVKVPTQWQFITEIPVTPLGKVLRRDLAALPDDPRHDPHERQS